MLVTAFSTIQQKIWFCSYRYKKCTWLWNFFNIFSVAKTAAYKQIFPKMDDADHSLSTIQRKIWFCSYKHKVCFSGTYRYILNKVRKFPFVHSKLDTKSIVLKIAQLQISDILCRDIQIHTLYHNTILWHIVLTQILGHIMIDTQVYVHVPKKMGRCSVFLFL